MCGIFGYAGPRNVRETLIQGLLRLTHRGYDAAGIGVVQDQVCLSRSVVGDVQHLEETTLQESWDEARVGIGHVRWPTHGKNTVPNAHPHFDCSHDIMLVHNGIIENDIELRQHLMKAGHRFTSETDTEILAHLIEDSLKQFPDSFSAIRHALSLVAGAYAIGICLANESNSLYVARMSSPLVIGIGEGEYFIGSEPYAFSDKTNQVLELDDGTVAHITVSNVRIETLKGDPRTIFAKTMQIPEHSNVSQKHPHRMLAEIHQQPEVIRQALLGRFHPDARGMNLPEIASCFDDTDRIVLLACGTAHHATLISKPYFESFAGIPAHVYQASEFQAGPFNVTKNSLLIAVSQSGETWDTRDALGRARIVSKHQTIALVNAACSSLQREVDHGFLMRAGIELGVAATKTFTAQCASLLLIALALGERSEEFTTPSEIETWYQRLSNLPDLIQHCLDSCEDQIKTIAHQAITQFTNTVFIGRELQFPVAMEGALKLKEIAYVPSDAQSAGELKHGPLALIDERCLSVVLMPFDEKPASTSFSKNLSSLREIQARGGPTLVVTTDDAPEGSFESTWTIRVPICDRFLLPILTIIPLQLLAYYWAVELGHNPDRPRNLAKSVTVA